MLKRFLSFFTDSSDKFSLKPVFLFCSETKFSIQLSSESFFSPDETAAENPAFSKIESYV